MSDETGPKLYTRLADWFHLLTAPADYASEAAFFLPLLRLLCDTEPRTLLELGCGGGNNASHLSAHLQLTLTDASAAMLAVSRRLNPACEHVQGDMRTLRLGREFDAVLVHDAIMYMTTEQDLRTACATAFAHCRAGGAAILAPDFVRETFRPSTSHGGHDDPGGSGRGLRYVEWTTDPDPSDSMVDVRFALLLREPDGSVRVESDHHVFGIFPRATWLALLHAAGFDAECVVDPYAREVFVARRRAR